MNLSWESCNLNRHILSVINGFGFQQMTPVQVATIPVFMKNKDVCVEAITGSGKTLAFIIPLLEILLDKGLKLKHQQVGCLIISPTRELATQIYEVLHSFLHPQDCPFTSSLIIGGHGDVAKDIENLETGANIVVGTPGRINACFQQSSSLQISLRTLEVLVLDEADRLLDLGFHKTLVSILSYLPKQRRTGLFSATQTHEVDQLIKAGMRNPVKISVAEKTETFAAAYNTSKVKTPSTLSNQYIVCETKQKFNNLVDVVMARKTEKILIFFATCACVDYFGRALKEFLGIKRNIFLLHGKMRKKRLSVFNEFRKMNSGILACTDVMARGIDIPDVDWVLQYDPPSNASAFVHRCGRTARVGKKGNALLFLLENESAYVDFIEINQKAPMLEHIISNDQANETDWLVKLRQLAATDRAMFEKGTRAYVSFVQSYSKHECNLIFRLKDLHFGELATGFALLKLPRMPELRNRKITDFEASDVDVSSIPYKNKAREKQRQITLKEKVSDEHKDEHKPKYVPKKFKAWTETRKRKEQKKERKQKRRLQKEKQAQRKKEISEKETQDDEDEDELEKDYKQFQALKRRKITKKEYNEEIANEEAKMFGDETTAT